MCTQFAIDRAVTVERELHRLQQKLKEADRMNAELVCQLKSSQADTLHATSNLKSTSLSLSVLQKNKNAAVLLLHKHVEHPHRSGKLLCWISHAMLHGSQGGSG